MIFKVKPHIGAGDLKLGMFAEEVQQVLGKPEYHSEKSEVKHAEHSEHYPVKYCYFMNELQITFDDDGRVDFIELSGRNAEFVKVYLQDIEIFKTPAPLLIEKISKLTNSEYDKEEEIPYSYLFRAIDLAFWRPVVPEKDEQSEHIPDTDEGKYFWTIGIGRKGYYKNV